MTNPTAYNLIQRLADALSVYDDDAASEHQVNVLIEARAYLAQPKPVTLTVAPTKEQVDEWATRLVDETRDVVIAVLKRWGNHAQQPIPIAERLPGEEDCDEEGKCWLCGKVERDWRLMNPNETGVPQLKYAFSHWLPHWVIPVPQERHSG